MHRVELSDLDAALGGGAAPTGLRPAPRSFFSQVKGGLG